MSQPLAERARPQTIEDYIGQKHLVGEQSILRRMLESGHVSSFILWGPPGVGKTTLANIIAKKLERPFFTLSAVSSGVKEVREVIEKAKSTRFFNSPTPILFIDEIHRFSKSQQDSLLGAVEQGIITLIGATTENPSFEVITPLLSRCQVYVLKSLEKEDLLELANRVIKQDAELKKKNIVLEETESLLRFSGGDARKLLNIIELVTNAEAESDTINITNEKVVERLQQNPNAYLCLHQIHSRKRSGCRYLLAGKNGSRRRRSEIYRPEAGYLRSRRHRTGKSERATAGKCLF